MNRSQQLRRRIHWLTWFFIVGLVVSGATAMPLLTELNWLVNWMGVDASSELARWLLRVRTALVQTQAQFPFLFYGAVLVLVLVY